MYAYLRFAAAHGRAVPQRCYRLRWLLVKLRAYALGEQHFAKPVCLSIALLINKLPPVTPGPSGG
jgi:hypothetical protein